MPSNPAATFRKLFPTSHRLLLEERIRAHLPELRGSVLVIGSGHDPYRALLRGCDRVTCIDIDASFVNVDSVADAHDLPFRDGAFDNVVCIEVFEHLERPWIAAQELLRVLKPGGTGVVSIPFMFRIHGDPFDFSRLTEQGIRSIFRSASEVSVQPFGGRLHVISDIITTSARFASTLRLANHLVARGPLRRMTSRDCPSGYWIALRK